jgi:hypothetical protein
MGRCIGARLITDSVMMNRPFADQPDTGYFGALNQTQDPMCSQQPNVFILLRRSPLNSVRSVFECIMFEMKIRDRE